VLAAAIRAIAGTSIACGQICAVMDPDGAAGPVPTRPPGDEFVEFAEQLQWFASEVMPAFNR
jgi:hypothetical protein